MNVLAVTVEQFRNLSHQTIEFSPNVNVIYGKNAQVALQGVRTIADCAGRMKGQIQLEYTPESFTGTEPDFALAICDAVVQEWKPTAELPVILNLASTMSLSLPHIYANQIEYFS